MQNAKCLRRTVLISVLKIYTKFYMHFRTREKIQKKTKNKKTIQSVRRYFLFAWSVKAILHSKHRSKLLRKALLKQYRVLTRAVWYLQHFSANLTERNEATPHSISPSLGSGRPCCCTEIYVLSRKNMKEK